MNCKNCGSDIKGNYCSHCGQRTSIRPLNFSNFTRELIDSTFQINSGLFFTIRQLFSSPGATIREYVAGKRKPYLKPVTYVLALSIIYFLISRAAGLNTWMNDLIEGYSLSANAGEVPGVLNWFASNYAYAILLLLPVYSLASFIAFYRSGSNYIEHIVLNTYITGQQALIYSFFALIRAFWDTELLETIPILIAVAYTFYAFLSYFKGNRFINTLATLLTYLLYLLFSLALLFLNLAIKS